MMKLIRRGKIAVLISSGYGAGWASSGPKEKAFDPDMVRAVLAGDHDKALAIANERYPDEDLTGISQLVVQWVTPGTRFYIHEYDGSERLVEITPDFGFEA